MQSLTILDIVILILTMFTERMTCHRITCHIHRLMRIQVIVGYGTIDWWKDGIFEEIDFWLLFFIYNKNLILYLRIFYLNNGQFIFIILIKAKKMFNFAGNFARSAFRMTAFSSVPKYSTSFLTKAAHASSLQWMNM